VPFALHAPSILYLLVATISFLVSFDSRRYAHPVRRSLLAGCCMCFAPSSVCSLYAVLQVWARYLHSGGTRHIICIATSTTHHTVSLHKHSCCIASQRGRAQLGSPLQSPHVASSARKHTHDRARSFRRIQCVYLLDRLSAAKATRLVRHAVYFWCRGSASYSRLAALGMSVAVTHAHASSTGS
jgi:hypothetical protein